MVFRSQRADGLGELRTVPQFDQQCHELGRGQLGVPLGQTIEGEVKDKQKS